MRESKGEKPRLSSPHSACLSQLELQNKVVLELSQVRRLCPPQSSMLTSCPGVVLLGNGPLSGGLLMREGAPEYD